MPEDKERIGEALVDLCYERGYQTISLPQLLDRAELAEASFRRHFFDLDDCLFQVHAVAMQRYHDRIHQARAGISCWRERLRASAYALARLVAEDEKLAHFAVVEGRRAGERSQLLLWEAIQDMCDLLDEGRYELDDPESLTRATAESIIGGIFDHLCREVSRRHVVPADEIVPQMMYSMLLPYLGAEAAEEELHSPPPLPVELGTIG
jgi:AcrR family transcriptional regulator